MRVEKDEQSCHRFSFTHHVSEHGQRQYCVIVRITSCFKGEANPGGYRHSINPSYLSEHQPFASVSTYSGNQQENTTQDLKRTALHGRTVFLLHDQNLLILQSVVSKSIQRSKPSQINSMIPSTSSLTGTLLSVRACTPNRQSTLHGIILLASLPGRSTPNHSATF